MKNVRETILEFIEREYKLPDDVDYETFDYTKSGYVDSMGLIQFIATLEDDFGISFSEKELLSEKFKTINGLEEIIMSKLKQ